MTSNAELEAQIRARDANWNDGVEWNGTILYAQLKPRNDGQSRMVGDRRTLLRLLDEARAEFGQAFRNGASLACRLAKADAEIERLRNIATTVKGIISSNVVEYDDVRNAIEMLESAALSPAPPGEGT